MAARASIINDIGDNALANWEYPFGTSDTHIALAIYSKDDKSLETVLEQARQSQRDLSKISVVYHMKFSELPDDRNPFGFKDGLHNPHVEGSGVDPLPGYNARVKAGEFITGYPDENGQTATSPEPEVLRHNGTFIAFRKFHQSSSVSQVSARACFFA
jgi:deferrochelatase/peroxidase EfeB